MPRRYFLTTNALKPVTVGGKLFTFEPVGNWGGSWLGVLATDDESDANILAGGANHTLEEISAQQFDAKKKHLSLTPNDSRVSMRQQKESPLSHAVADRAGSLSPPFANNGGPNSTEAITRVSVLKTERQPPKEPILESGGPRKRW